MNDTNRHARENDARRRTGDNKIRVQISTRGCRATDHMAYHVMSQKSRQMKT